ncbi:hypothetical protein V8G54_005657 [Vigna mungo]|uniref:Uncharacterized protein n=1 Tax=Vigna mungo TaxID=3915 RepID=A0AAQ3NYN5_VIGMU
MLDNLLAINSQSKTSRRFVASGATYSIPSSVWISYFILFVDKFTDAPLGNFVLHHLNHLTSLRVMHVVVAVVTGSPNHILLINNLLCELTVAAGVVVANDRR